MLDLNTHARDGVRIALGARTQNILRLVVGEGLRVVLFGIAIGTLIAVALVASLVPAFRAARSDPADAPRSE